MKDGVVGSIGSKGRWDVTGGRAGVGEESINRVGEIILKRLVTGVAKKW